MTFDPTKPVQTRDGRKARIICTDAENEHYPVVALIKGSTGAETPEAYAANGHTFFGDGGGRDKDLINTPEEPKTAKVWVAVFEDDEGVWCSASYKGQKHAKQDWKHHAVACVPVTISYRPGEGLEDE